LHKFSQELEFLLQQLVNQPLTLKQLLERTQERGCSLIITLLSLPFLLPMPPGLAGVLGSGCFLLGIQMALGRRSLWLPKKVAQWKFPRGLSQQLLRYLHKITGVLEKITRPRWQKVADHPYTCRVNGLCTAWLAILLMLPIPFTNPIPTIGILLLAIANLEKDGVLMCLGYGLTIMITLLFAYVFWLAPDLLPYLLPQRHFD
jgi:hypothetical protein